MRTNDTPRPRGESIARIDLINRGWDEELMTKPPHDILRQL